MWRGGRSGALGTRYNLLETFVKASPLLLTGLAVAFAFRAKFWNIGAEGQLLAGALAALGVSLLHDGGFGSAPSLPRQELFGGLLIFDSMTVFFRRLLLLFAVLLLLLMRITRIAQIQKLGAFHHATIGHIEAWNNSFSQHE